MSRVVYTTNIYFLQVLDTRKSKIKVPWLFFDDTSLPSLQTATFLICLYMVFLLCL